MAALVCCCCSFFIFRVFCDTLDGARRREKWRVEVADHAYELRKTEMEIQTLKRRIHNLEMSRKEDDPDDTLVPFLFED